MQGGTYGLSYSVMRDCCFFPLFQSFAEQGISKIISVPILLITYRCLPTNVCLESVVCIMPTQTTAFLMFASLRE